MSNKSTVAMLMGATVALMALPVVGMVRASAHADAPPAVAGEERCRGFVALTFDDGPTPLTPKLLDTLAKRDVRATMFNVGANALERPDLVRDELAGGHAVENHTNTHPDLVSLDAAAVASEITEANAALRAAGASPRWFRPPYGNTDAHVKAELSTIGLREVLWTTDTFDWKASTTSELVARALEVEPGGIILMHDGEQGTLDALPAIVDGLAERGLCPGQIVPSATEHAPPGWKDNTYRAEAGPWTPA